MCFGFPFVKKDLRKLCVWWGGAYGNYPSGRSGDTPCMGFAGPTDNGQGNGDRGGSRVFLYLSLKDSAGRLVDIFFSSFKTYMYCQNLQSQNYSRIGTMDVSNTTASIENIVNLLS